MKMTTQKNNTQGFVLILTVFAFILWGCDTNQEMIDDAPEVDPEAEMEHAPHPEEDHHHDHEAEPPAEDLEVSGTVENGVRVVEVQARQFEFEPERIVVEEGEEIRLLVTSEDVPHGIMIMELDINENLPTNETVAVEFTAPEPGNYHFHCSIYCGPGHDRMHGDLTVLEAER